MLSTFLKCLDPVHTFPARFSHELLEAVAELERLCCGSLPEAASYAGVMATMFIQQSTEYIQQIEAEIERLQQLRAQVRATIQSEEQLENAEQVAPQKGAARKSTEKKAASKKVAAKKRGRPKA